MKTLTRVAEMQVAAAGLRGLGKRIGFVPTMGTLHQGHLSLVRAAQERADAVVVSIFVNPAQFGPGEDYRSYPRDLESDRRRLEGEAVEILFSPTTEEIYPEGFQSYLTVERLSEPLCGRFRPGHFRGVTTVVLKLFHIVQPHLAFFGRKDAQQSVLIRQLVRDLHLPIEVVVCPIVREPDGLAMSSRNAYLSQEERQAALVLSQALRQAKELMAAGERNPQTVQATLQQRLAAESRARVDYVEIVDPETLEPKQHLEGGVLIALAVWIGRARLIDNLLAEEINDHFRFEL